MIVTQQHLEVVHSDKGKSYKFSYYFIDPNNVVVESN